MAFKVIWSENALSDLRQLCDFIAQDNPKAAEKMGRGILDHVQILGTFPLIGRNIPVALVDRIFYDVSEKTGHVEILHIWHGARDEPTFPT